MMEKSVQISDAQKELFNRLLWGNGLREYMSELELQQERTSARDEIKKVFCDRIVPENIIREYLKYIVDLNKLSSSKEQIHSINATVCGLAEFMPQELRIFVEELGKSSDYSSKLAAAQALYKVYNDENSSVKLLEEIANAYLSGAISSFPSWYFEIFEDCKNEKIRNFFTDLDAKITEL